MKLLLDTHLLLWLSARSQRLAETARQLITDPDNEVIFSIASIWEIAIKFGLTRSDFRVDPGLLRQALLDNQCTELLVTGAHAIAVATLPPIHRDPFDRLLVAQAGVEGITLLTADAVVARYPGTLWLV